MQTDMPASAFLPLSGICTHLTIDKRLWNLHWPIQSQQPGGVFPRSKGSPEGDVSLPPPTLSPMTAREELVRGPSPSHPFLLSCSCHVRALRPSLWWQLGPPHVSLCRSFSWLGASCWSSSLEGRGTLSRSQRWLPSSAQSHGKDRQ